MPLIFPALFLNHATTRLNLRRRRADAIHHVERGRQHFILDLDEMNRLAGDVFVLGRHNRDGRPNLDYLLVEQIPVRRSAA